MVEFEGRLYANQNAARSARWRKEKPEKAAELDKRGKEAYLRRYREDPKFAALQREYRRERRRQNPEHFRAYERAYNRKTGRVKGTGSPKGEANWNAILTEDRVREIWRFVKSGGKQCEAARMCGVSISTVSRIMSGERWAHITRTEEEVAND